jgi:hypothetical protein
MATMTLMSDADLLDEIPVEAPTGNPSPAQARLMVKLIEELAELDRTAWEQAVDYTRRMSGRWTLGPEGNASRWIDRLIAKLGELRAARRPAGPAPALPEVPAGRYAVEEAGTLKFFHVRHGKPGTRWEGFVFLDIQASDETHAIRDRARKAQILALIAQDVEAALCRYGQELGVCGDCGRTLTDETSRAIGRGPVCRSK